ncbi:MAG TPA: glycoside hydrolase family 28 protein [Gemmatirosa sp.]
MDPHRRSLIKGAGAGLAAATVATAGAQPAGPPSAPTGAEHTFDVRRFGATGDGRTVDSPAINRAIAAAAAAGGGTVVFPAGTYASYSIRLRSFVALALDAGATILAAPTPLEGTTTGGYDAAEPQGAWEPYQDYGHNHWHNSLLWGEDLQHVAIVGSGMIWGKGLSRGHDTDRDLPNTTRPGVGNKAIALKNCRNVLLRDFSILQGGWFGLLATGVDNLTIDNLTIDTNRDGVDIDCCRNVHVSNCTVNSPFDDGICPKSSYALGYARATENVTITNCYVTGDFEVGTVLDGTFRRRPASQHATATGRIKFGTESNGGFLNITVANCVFESCRGFALETVDGARLEDVTITNVTMRDLRNSPLFLRLGARMRGPAGAAPGTLRRVLIRNLTSYGAVAMPSIITGVPGQMIEDVSLDGLHLHQVGGGTREMAMREPPELERAYPEPGTFGDIPATGLFARHVHNLSVSNVDVVTESADARPAFWLADVNGADFFRIRAPRSAAQGPAFSLQGVRDFRVFGSRGVPDTTLDAADRRTV